jgi:hypothetical protein
MLFIYRLPNRGFESLTLCFAQLRQIVERQDVLLGLPRCPGAHVREGTALKTPEGVLLGAIILSLKQCLKALDEGSRKRDGKGVSFASRWTDHDSILHHSISLSCFRHVFAASSAHPFTSS